MRLKITPTYSVLKHFYRSFSSRQLSNVEVTKKRNELFGKEKARQMALLVGIEKIEVVHKGPPEDCTMLMNKHMSTPFNCAMHISELLMTRSALALVNGQPWDMHRPLEEDCELKFLHFKDDDPGLCNKAFWRTGSFLLGYMLERAFKEDYYVELCSFPKPNIRSGSFVYDVDLKAENWKPTMAEKNCLSRLVMNAGGQNERFERLDVDASRAQQMFTENRFKSAQIPQIAAQSEDGCSVTLYRIGDHVDITRGPLIATPNQIGRFAVTAIHDLESPEFGKLSRVQGLALPKQTPIHHWAYEFLGDRAAKFNDAPAPTLNEDTDSKFNLLSS